LSPEAKREGEGKGLSRIGGGESKSEKEKRG